MYPPKLGTIVSNYSDNDLTVTDLLGRASRGDPAYCECTVAIRHLPAATQDKYIDPYTHHVRKNDTAFLTNAG